MELYGGLFDVFPYEEIEILGLFQKLLVLIDVKNWVLYEKRMDCKKKDICFTEMVYFPINRGLEAYSNISDEVIAILQVCRDA